MSRMQSAGLHKLSAIIKWFVFLAIALIVLVGRYNWAPEMRQVSLRAYLSSAYMLCLTLPTIYYILSLYVRKIAIARGWTAAIAVLFVLPYRWLGLEQWYYNAHRPSVYELPSMMQHPESWMPRGGLLRVFKALPHLGSIPHEIAFFGSLIMAGIAVAILWRWTPWSRSAEQSPRHTKTAVAWLGLFLLLLLQTWLHMSMRSPYVYLPHFEQPESANYWYAQYLFPEGKGAVNADYKSYFRPMDDLFLGVPSKNPDAGTDATMIRRAYPHYLSTQLSYFFSPYYVYLFFNISLWFLACISAYRLAALLWNRRVAVYATAMAGTGPGFIMFVAQPMSYLAGYSVVILITLLLEEALIRKEEKSIKDFLAFGCALGLASMVGPLFPVYAGLILYALIRRVSLPHLAVGFGLAAAVYLGFMQLQTGILGVHLESLHTNYMESSWQNIYSLFFHAHLGPLYRSMVQAFRTYFGSMVNAFFVVPALIALAGAFLLRDRTRTLLPLAMGVPSLLAVIFLQFGGARWGIDENGIPLFLAALPRFAYIAYPAVYFLMAMALDAFREYCLQRSTRKPFIYAANAAPWLVLALCFYLSNVDVWKYPQMYYLFCYPSCNVW
jgi:hypothetical protein